MEYPGNHVVDPKRMRKRQIQNAYRIRHHDELLRKARERRARNREPSYKGPTTAMCEERLPEGLKRNKMALRDEFRKIPIHKRPSYDYFLRQKTVEYLKENYARRQSKDSIAW